VVCDKSAFQDFRFKLAPAETTNAVDGGGRREHFGFGHGNCALDVNAVSTTRIRAARAVAISADVLQIAVFPLFAEGFISPLDDALDVLVCLVLTWLVGWYYAFLPSFIVKVVPMMDLAPTWTIAILFATRGKKVSREVQSTQVYAEPPSPPLLKAPPHE
jgi:hypothetical protein